MDTSLSIKDTSQAAGVTPSVLRVWEHRYGWPKPTRQGNGYRVYSSMQVDEIKRIADLVKQGLAISSLIVDGEPTWPSASSQPLKKQLTRTRALPRPAEAVAAQLHLELVDALEGRRVAAAKEVLQRLFWTVRPQEEVPFALVPSAMAVAEIRAGGHPLPEGQELLDLVRERCVQLLRMQGAPSDAIAVVPARGGDHAIAALVAVALCARGVPARPWVHLQEPTVPYVLASEGECPPRRAGKHVGTVTTLGESGTIPLADLLDAAKPMPWQARRDQPALTR